jgi:glycosyltransferase involved in cell wall biosynthesis
MSVSQHLRIEMMLPTMARAGMETVTATLGRELRRRGHEVGFTCILGPGEIGEELAREGFRVANVPAPGLRPNVVARELGGWLATVGPDVVHIHSGLWLKGVQAARHAGIPATIYTHHGVRPVDPWYMPWLNRIAARRTARMVAVSESVQRYLIEVAGAPADRVSVIPNGVPTDRFRARGRAPELRQRLGIPRAAAVIGCVARLHPIKNHELLVNAFALVRQRRPDAFLLLVGDGPLRAAIERLAVERGLQSAVCVTGVLPDTAPLYNEMVVHALASRTEGTSISLLEAMASEVPVVATAVGGNPALLDGGRLGLLVPPADATALAGAILELLEDASLRERLTSTARAELKQSYSVESMAERYEAVYRRTITAGHRTFVPAH